MNERKEYQLLLPCRLASPLSCGGNPSQLTDADLRRDGQGRLVVPGTSLAGVLRTAVERLSGEDCKITEAIERGDKDSLCQCSVCRLFGDVRPASKLPEEEGLPQQASRVSVFDAVVSSGDDGKVKTRIVDSVAMNDRRQTADDAKKFDYAEVFPGATLQVELRVENPTETELAWLGEALRQLGTGRLTLGGRSARGSGRLEAFAEQATLRYRDLNEKSGLLAAILHDDGNSNAWPEVQCEGLDQFPRYEGAAETTEIRFELRPAPESSFLVADPVEAVQTGFDHAPRGGAETPELPAASLRGCLRAAAGRVERTLRNGGDASLTSKLFGTTDAASRVVVSVHPCGDRATAAPFDHVAIDRFTGGASDKKKFNALASRGASFEATLSFTHLAEEQDKHWMVGLLCLALGEIHCGRAALGYGSARGHGMFYVHEPKWNGFDLNECVAAVAARIR